MSVFKNRKTFTKKSKSCRPISKNRVDQSPKRRNLRNRRLNHRVNQLILKLGSNKFLKFESSESNDMMINYLSTQPTDLKSVLLMIDPNTMHNLITETFLRRTLIQESQINTSQSNTLTHIPLVKQTDQQTTNMHFDINNIKKQSVDARPNRNDIRKYDLRIHLLNNVYPSMKYENNYQKCNDLKQDNEFKQDLAVEFSDHVIQKLREINLPYNQRKSKTGMIYATDYDKSAYWTLINGLAPEKYWGHNNSDELCFVANDQRKNKFTPSHALSAFFSGPTFADCGTALLATIHHALLMIKGVDEFDQLFGNMFTRLIITVALFHPFIVENKSITGNPLFSIFDLISHQDLELNKLKHGDFVYIQGVDKYCNKHLSGNGQGWNLITVKDNSTNFETKFLGFGPDKESFANGPISYQELVKSMIDSYNSDHDDRTNYLINNSNIISEYVLNVVKSLKNDKIGYEYKEVGEITYGMRLNVKAFNDLSSHQLQKNRWYQKCLKPDLVKLPKNRSALCSKFSTPFTKENIKSSFDTYIPENERQQKTLNHCIQFTNQLIQQSNKSPKMLDLTLGLILSGSPGIGKTHLAVSVAKYCMVRNVKVLYLNSAMLSETCQMHAGSYDFSKFIEDDTKLFIIDDVNLESPIQSRFCSNVITHCRKHNRSFMITSNHIIKTYDNMIASTHFPFNDDVAWNIVVLDNLVSLSFREKMSDNHASFRTITTLEHFSQHFSVAIQRKNQFWPAGLCVENSEIDIRDCEMICRQLMPNAKIYIPGKPYSNNRVHDLYVHDLNNKSGHNVVILKINFKVKETFGWLEQFIKTMLKVHDMGIIMIVITDDASKIHNKFVNDSCDKYGFDKYGFDNTTKIMERMRLVFPFLLSPRVI